MTLLLGFDLKWNWICKICHQFLVSMVVNVTHKHIPNSLSRLDTLLEVIFSKVLPVRNFGCCQKSPHSSVELFSMLKFRNGAYLAYFPQTWLNT